MNLPLARTECQTQDSWGGQGLNAQSHYHDHDTHDQGNDKHTSVGIKPLIRQISKLIMVIMSIMMIRIQKLVSDSQKGVFEMGCFFKLLPNKGTVQEERVLL